MLAATVWSSAHLSLGRSDRNTASTFPDISSLSLRWKPLLEAARPLMLLFSWIGGDQDRNRKKITFASSQAKSVLEHLLESSLNENTRTTLDVRFSLVCNRLASRVVCGAYLRLLAPWTAWLLWQLVLHRWRVNGRTVRGLFPFTNP